MKLLFISPLILVILKSCLATGNISFNTTLLEVDETDYNQVILKVERNGGTDGQISFTCEVCKFLACMPLTMH
jgi:rRNA maturation protein Rpf1